MYCWVGFQKSLVLTSRGYGARYFLALITGAGGFDCIPDVLLACYLLYSVAAAVSGGVITVDGPLGLALMI